jgi:hypothetical protein
VVLLAGCGSDSGSDGRDGDNDGRGDSDDGNYFTENFPVFDALDESGSGDSTITLPGAYGIIEASHDGDANFALTVLDSNNQETGDLPVNTIGSYSGTTAFGFDSIAGDPAALQVTAGGSWSVTIKPISDAPDLPDSGSGDGVFRYEGGAADWHLTHDGSENFIVSEYTGDALDIPLQVNEIGAYEGTVPAKAGPAVVVIKADGSWTLTAD